jgi:pimeloyl-ACP methyl ester carboxylesterase
MQQQIGFCTTADGARIAYAAVGSGPVLIFAQFAPSHLEFEWEEPRIREFWEAISRHHKVVRYDKHGCGLSDRNRTDFSVESEVRTIEAIVKELGLKSFLLWGHGPASQAIAYAVKHPYRVSHLILCGAQARWHGLPASWSGVHPETLRALAASNLRMSQLSVVETFLGSTFDAGALQWYLRTRQEALTPEMFEQLISRRWWNMDVRDLLPKVRVPTLVIQYRDDGLIPFEAGREVAAGIPGARFVSLEGGAHFFYFCDTRPLRRAIAEFLGDSVEDAAPPPSDSPKVPSTPAATQGVFRKEGEFWTIACSGEVFRLKDVRGLAYIASLLGHPGEELHVLSLASKAGGSQDDLAEGVAEEQATQSNLPVGQLGNAGEMLDAQAKASYKRRVTELREQLQEARERNQF